MSCQEIHDLLLEASPRHRSALSAPEAREHLESCAACRNELEALEGLWTRTAELEESIEPSRDLWPGIEARLRSRSERTGVGFWGLRVAAALLLLLGGALLDRALLREVAPTATVAEAPEVLRSDASRAGEVDRGRQGYREARGALWRRALEGRANFGPRELEGLLEGLAATEEARWALEAALSADPGNPKTIGMLERIRRRELSLLRRLALPDRESVEPEDPAA